MSSNSSVRVDQTPLANSAQSTDSLLGVSNPTNPNTKQLCRFQINNLFSAADLITQNFTPANSSANVAVNSIWHDNTYLYVCVGNNHIKRIILSDF